MKIFMAHSGSLDCLPNCAEWISFEGMFDKSTPGQFRDLLAGLGTRRPPILISSGGGDVDAAMEIGRLARAKGFDVVIARTEALAADPNPPGAGIPAGSAGDGNGARAIVDYARPTLKSAFCASACTFLLAAGKRRAVAPGVRVGLHEMLVPEQDADQHIKYFQTHYWTKNGRVVSKETRVVGERDLKRHINRHNAHAADYVRVRRYLAEMQLPADEIIKLMKTASPENISWLSRSELEQTTRLATEGSTPVAFLGLERKALEGVSAGAVQAPSDQARARRPEPGVAERLGLSYGALVALATVTLAFCVAIFRSLLRLRRSVMNAPPREPKLGG